MAYTKYSLTPANNTAAPPDGAPEGMLPSAVNDTMRDMMAQIRDCGDGIRDGTYTMTAPKITGGTITGATVTSNTFSSSGATITGGTINSTAIGGTTAAAGKFTTLEATGVTTVQAGTVSAPAITTSGDTNTGIFFPAADTIAFSEGGAESMRIDSSGNVGIGTSSPTVKLDAVVTGNSINSIVAARNTTSGTAAGSQILVGNDSSSDLLVLRALSSTYTSSGINTANGSLIRAGGAGGMTLASTDGSGIINFATGGTTERMRIDSSGNVGIGNTSASSFAATTNLALGTGSSSAALTVYTGTAQTGAVYFADGTTSADRYRGAIEYSHSSNALLFTTDASERMRIDSSGNLLVGTTSTLLASGNSFVNNTTAGDSPQLILRNDQNTAGRYWKVGAVGGAGGANPYMIVYNASNAGVYMGYGDTNWSSTSDESKKENLTPITDAITKLSSLRTVIGNFIDDKEKTKHPFLIAQDVQKVLPEAVNEKDGVLGLKYSDMIPLLVASIKELNAKVDAQAAEIANLKAK